ncbi:hypothetical protein D6783_04140 [Candidatus Woesearchaeota archaeon]|nr:MAG: hypothetical protein D6783_04140 [Candidatus Woesearchaeota archaeon]
MKKEDKNLVVAGGVAGVLGALCCVGPVVIVLLGLGSVSTALTIGRYSWLFTGLALLFFGLAVVLYLRKKNSCSAKGVRQNWKLVAASFVLLVVLLFVLKYGLAPLLAKIAYR